MINNGFLVRGGVVPRTLKGEPEDRPIDISLFFFDGQKFYPVMRGRAVPRENMILDGIDTAGEHLFLPAYFDAWPGSWDSIVAQGWSEHAFAVIKDPVKFAALLRAAWDYEYAKLPPSTSRDRERAKKKFEAIASDFSQHIPREAVRSIALACVTAGTQAPSRPPKGPKPAPPSAPPPRKPQKPTGELPAANDRPADWTDSRFDLSELIEAGQIPKPEPPKGPSSLYSQLSAETLKGLLFDSAERAIPKIPEFAEKWKARLEVVIGNMAEAESELAYLLEMSIFELRRSLASRSELTANEYEKQVREREARFDELIRINEPEESKRPAESVIPETAESLFRVVDTMRGGECPSCLHKAYLSDFESRSGFVCPRCRFSISNSELETIDNLRDTRKQVDADAFNRWGRRGPVKR